MVAKSTLLAKLLITLSVLCYSQIFLGIVASEGQELSLKDVLGRYPGPPQIRLLSCDIGHDKCDRVGHDILSQSHSLPALSRFARDLTDGELKDMLRGCTTTDPSDPFQDDIYRSGNTAPVLSYSSIGPYQIYELEPAIALVSPADYTNNGDTTGNTVNLHNTFIVDRRRGCVIKALNAEHVGADALYTEGVVEWMGSKFFFALTQLEARSNAFHMALVNLDPDALPEISGASYAVKF